MAITKREYRNEVIDRLFNSDSRFIFQAINKNSELLHGLCDEIINDIDEKKTVNDSKEKYVVIRSDINDFNGDTRDIATKKMFYFFNKALIDNGAITADEFKSVVKADVSALSEKIAANKLEKVLIALLDLLNKKGTKVLVLIENYDKTPSFWTEEAYSLMRHLYGGLDGSSARNNLSLITFTSKSVYQVSNLPAGGSPFNNIFNKADGEILD